MKRLLVLLTITLLFAGCKGEPTSLSELAANPNRYADQSLEVTGTITRQVSQQTETVICKILSIPVGKVSVPVYGNKEKFVSLYEMQADGARIFVQETTGGCLASESELHIGAQATVVGNWKAADDPAFVLEITLVK